MAPEPRPSGIQINWANLLDNPAAIDPPHLIGLKANAGDIETRAGHIDALRGAVTSYVDKLWKSLVRAGIDRRLATACCRSLVNTTINHTIVEAQALRQPQATRAGGSDAKKRKQSFPRTIDWIIAGVRQEALSATTTGRRR